MINRGLLRTVHAWVAGVALITFVSLSITLGQFGPPTRSSPSGRWLLLISGWVTLALFLAAYAYVLRKYAHKVGYSPEFKMKLPRADIERAHNKLDDIRYRMASGTLKDPVEILERARAILRGKDVPGEKGVNCEKILRVRVVTGPVGPELVIARTEPLVRVARWMHAHLYYGFAGGILSLAHGGAKFVSPMGVALNVLTVLVIGTGLVGLVFWLYGPTWLTRLERDLTTEEVFVLSRHYDRRVNETLAPVDQKDRALAASIRNTEPQPSEDQIAKVIPVLVQAALEKDANMAVAVKKTVEETGKTFPFTPLTPESALASATALARDLRTLCGQRHRLKRENARLSRARFSMNAWRIVHIPASIALLAVIAVHVISVLLY